MIHPFKNIFHNLLPTATPKAITGKVFILTLYLKIPLKTLHRRLQVLVVGLLPLNYGSKKDQTQKPTEKNKAVLTRGSDFLSIIAGC